MAAALAAAGMAQELRTPLMTCEPGRAGRCRRRDVRGLAVGPVGDGDLRDAARVQRAAFGQAPLAGRRAAARLAPAGRRGRARPASTARRRPPRTWTAVVDGASEVAGRRDRGGMAPPRPGRRRHRRGGARRVRRRRAPVRALAGRRRGAARLRARRLPRDGDDAALVRPRLGRAGAAWCGGGAARGRRRRRRRRGRCGGRSRLRSSGRWGRRSSCVHGAARIAIGANHRFRNPISSSYARPAPPAHLPRGRAARRRSRARPRRSRSPSPRSRSRWRRWSARSARCCWTAGPAA